MKTGRFSIFLIALLLSSITGCRGCGGGGGGRTVIECSADFLCPSGLYCELGKTCGGIDRKGLCAYQPTDCPREDSAVCGCDGREYPSVCYANASGITVAYPGKCMRSVQRS